MKQVIHNILLILNAREKRAGWLLAIADVCISILDIVFLVALLYLVRFYTQQVPTRQSTWIASLISTQHPLQPILLFSLFFALKNAAGFVVAKMQYRFIYRIASRVSGEMMKRFLNGSYEDYVAIDSSMSNRSISQQPIEFAHYVLNGVQQVFSQTVLAVITLLAVLLINPLLFPLLLIILVPPIILVQWLLKRKLREISLYGKRTSEQTMQLLQEGLQAFIESNLYQKNNFFLNRYHRLQVKLNHYLSTRLIIQNMPPRLMEVFAIFGFLSLVLVNEMSGQSHSISLVSIGALLVATYKIIPGIVKITNMMAQVRAYAYSAEALALVAGQHEDKQGMEDTIETLGCTDLVFGYPQKEVVRQFTTGLRKTDFAVLRGASGKGKTTLVHLLLGFLSPSAGDILINNKPTDKAARQSYWMRIAYVKQQAFFLHASIAENICLHENIYDAARLQWVIDASGLSTLIDSLPGGIHAMVTENGKNFSGGQRQRIAFARALYKDFDFLILDEPFNELDEASERGMLMTLQQIAAGGKIVLLVTHNSTAMEFGNKEIHLN